MAIANTQKNTQDQPSTVTTRERQSLTALTVELEGGRALQLTNISYLPENSGKKATFGGLVANYIDPVTGQPCHFAGRNGEIIAGGLPVRLFGSDAELAIEALGEAPGHTLLLGVADAVDGAIYRKDDGEVAYAAISIKALTGAFRWVSPIKFQAV
jgi:hypothetical protein